MGTFLGNEFSGNTLGSQGLEAVRALAAGESRALKIQLHPHLLFSALHGIATLIDSDPANAKSMLVDLLPQLQLLTKPQSSRLALKAKGKIVFIDPDDVIAIQAEGNYVLLLCRLGSHLLRESISVMEEQLEPYGFIRVHRSVLVNTAFVEEIQPWPTGEYALRLKGGKEFTVTRTYKKNLKSLAHFWIGTERFLEGIER